MIRFLLRVIGVALLASAFASAVIDGTRSVAAGALSVTSFGDACLRTFPTKFPLFEASLRAKLPDWAWDSGAMGLFRLPTWLVLAILGLILLRLARRRKRPIGYSSRD